MRNAAYAANIFSNSELLTSIADGHPLIAPGGFDLGLLAWWPHIVKDNILDLSRRGFLNFHPSFLPYGRGKNPNFWALVGDTPFGVSIHWVDGSIDGGDIAFQKTIEKSWGDNGQSLYEKSKKEIVALFRECLPRILAGDVPRIPQPGFPVHYARELDPASHIDLNREYRARDLLNLLRARTFAGYPGCWFTEDGKKYEVRVNITNLEGSETQ